MWELSNSCFTLFYFTLHEILIVLCVLIHIRCNAIRAGITANILAEDLVPGDVIQLMSGDRVPADCRVLMCTGKS
jgi:magnesium-transporting ATPase (P-type)